MAKIRCGIYEVDAIPGEDVLTLLVKNKVPMQFLCMGGTCGTCWMRVLKGAEHLEPITIGERFHVPRSRGEERLACQAIVRGTGDVEITQNE